MISLSQKAKAAVRCAVLIFFATAIAFAQLDTATIVGVVTDASGASVAGATVQIQNLDTGLSRTEHTDQSGRYQSQNLPLGAYSVTVQQSGFKTEERRGITLTVASQAAVNVQLAVGTTQETVEVTAAALAIETTNATVSSLVTADQIRDLPLNGRSVDQLTLLTPGLSLDRSGLQSSSLGEGTKLSINGSRTNYVLYLLDGTVVNDASGGGPGSAAHNMLGVEGVLEFRFISHDFSAEYGHAAGGVLSQVTRSGTNQFHGSAYEFLRNNVVDARNFFNLGGLPPYRRNQFGGALGGRIIKDKLFFFANYEGLRQLQGTPINIAVPDANARQGLLPCSAVPNGVCNTATGLAPTTVNQNALPFVNLYPLPTGPEIGNGTAQYATTFFGISSENYSMERVDYHLTDKDNIFARYVYNPSSATTTRPVPIWGETDTGLANFLVLSETHIISATSLNEFRASYNRTLAQGLPATFQPIPDITMVPGQALGRIQFAATIGAAGQLPELGTDTGRPQTFIQNLFTEADTFSLIRGAHSLKFGVEVEREQLNLSENQGLQRAKVAFGGLAGLLAGTPTSVSVVIPGGNNHFVRGDRRMIYGMFVQDEYRMRPNLTLTLGLREDIFGNPSEVNGYMGDLRNLTDSAVTPGTGFIPRKNTLAPRAGIAWDPFGDGKTSIRVGGGLYYNPVDGREMYEPSTGTPLFLNTIAIGNTAPFPNVLANGFNSGLQSTTAAQYNARTPAVAQYNFEIQRQLTRTMSLRVGYVGSTGWSLTRQSQWNLKIPTIQPDGSLLFPASGPTQNPNFSTIAYYSTDARSNYNGLQTTLQKNLANGLQFQASYTWAKAMSNADQAVNAISNNTPSAALDPTNLGRDWSPSVYDQRQAVIVSGVYQIPLIKGLSNNRFAKALLGGWAFNEIYTYGSGLAFDIEDGFNNSRNGDTNNPDRPNLNPGFSNNPVNGVTAGCPGIPAGQPLHTVARWFDPCAFSLSPAGTYGNMGRNTVYMPGTNNVDATFVKSTTIYERLKLEFRWELFNLLNHAAFATPNQSIFTSSRTINASAGQITSTLRDNREMQFGLKLVF